MQGFPGAPWPVRSLSATRCSFAADVRNRLRSMMACRRHAVQRQGPRHSEVARRRALRTEVDGFDPPAVPAVDGSDQELPWSGPDSTWLRHLRDAGCLPISLRRIAAGEIEFKRKDRSALAASNFLDWIPCRRTPPRRRSPCTTATWWFGVQRIGFDSMASCPSTGIPIRCSDRSASISPSAQRARECTHATEIERTGLTPRHDAPGQ